MAKFDNNFTDELRARLSIYDVVSRRVPLTKKGQNYWGCCPFHNEKTPSFSINEEKGFYHCFGCGEHGDIIGFTMKTGNMDFIAAISELADMAGIKMPTFKPKSEQQIKSENSYLDITNSAALLYNKKLFEPGAEHALDYIRGRGFSDADIQKYKIGYAPKNNIISNTLTNYSTNDLIKTGLVRTGDYGKYDFFREKLMFPITNEKGNIVAFSGRSLDGTEPKYINTIDTELFHKRKTVFGLSFAKENIYRANRSIIVEGQIDAIKMQLSEFGETVAPLGTALTEDHIAMLCKINRNIIFAFDGDNAGRKAAVRAADIIMPFIRDTSDVKFAFMPNGADPDDILKQDNGKTLMNKILDSAKTLTDFLWDITNENYLVSTPGGRVQADKFLQKILEKITDKNLKSEYEKEYSSRKFKEWHSWKKDKNKIKIDVPKIDNITTDNLIQIIEHYPEIAEQHIEFLSTFNLKRPDSEIKNTMDFKTAEKYIVSLKLKKFIDNLQSEKKELTVKLLNGDDSVSARLTEIESDLDKAILNQNKLINI